jgi:nucleotidyltransferase substrate binding protein (TIGR01987 family)
MELHFTARFKKFRDSLISLKKINTIIWPEDEDLFGFIWCGVISKFCITFDLSYKLAKDILVEYHGITNFAKGSPREILKEAYATNIIDDENWLSMLKDRNTIVHEYKDLDSVEEWCKKITEKYIPLFEKLFEYTEKIL